MYVMQRNSKYQIRDSHMAKNTLVVTWNDFLNPNLKFKYDSRSLHLKLSNARRSGNLQGAHAISISTHPSGCPFYYTAFPKWAPLVCLNEK